MGVEITAMSNLVVDIRHAQVFQSDQVVLMDVNLRISKGNLFT
ncbi:MAG: hypothetical protein R2795_11585 [Saprospiraceae bacterium]